MPKKEKKLFVVFTIVFFTVMLMTFVYSKQETQIPACGDGTSYDVCSKTKPYFCENGLLIEKASICGCNNLSWQSVDLCYSRYESYPKEINLGYMLNEAKNHMNLIVYGEMTDYLSRFPRTIEYNDGQIPSRADFKLKAINEEEQRELLMPLVIKIQNLNSDRVEQARIAISLVQSIPYGTTDKTIFFPTGEINYSKYPYEVLYYNQGICGEKSALLAFLFELHITLFNL